MIPSTCPYCGHTFQIKRDTMAIAGINPIIDKRLNDGTYFSHKCSKCQHLYYLEQPFLYHDPNKRYILILSNMEHIPNMNKDELVIRCKNAIQFLFCYKVLSQGLNLRLVLQKKHSLEQKLHAYVDFDTYDAGCLWFKTKEELYGIRLKEAEILDVYQMKNRK